MIPVLWFFLSPCHCKDYHGASIVYKYTSCFAHYMYPSVPCFIKVPILLCTLVCLWPVCSKHWADTVSNMYNVEIRNNDNICCCDASTCFNNLDDFSVDTCDPRCDTYFVLSFMECQDFAPCPVTKTTDVSTNSDTTTNVNYKFSFNVSSSAIEPVRVWVLSVTKHHYSSMITVFTMDYLYV